MMFMRRLRYLLIFLASIALVVSTPSCISDAISTSPSDVLSFSRDTVSFDTVFTDLGTPTARLVVRNPNKKGVIISSIRFQNPDTRFQLNVDGVSGRSFSDVEIRGRDSIFVFIECFIPEGHESEPTLTEDKLEFITNGVTQSVQVEAYGQNVTRMRAITLDSDFTMTADRPYVIFDSLVVAPQTTLTIEPGAKLLFHDKASLVVHGRINAVGAPDKLIHLRGDRLDNVLPDVGYDIMAGQWAGMFITPDSYDNRLEYVNMRSTASGLRIDSCSNLERTKLTLVNSWLHNSQSTVIESKYARVDAYGCVFSDAADAVVALYGGKHIFSQCTISNYYLFAAISQPLLSLYHCLPPQLADSDPNPLMEASFENSIIYGMAADINEGDLTGSQVFLRNVLLKTEGTDDDNFIHCLWGKDPMFCTERSEYYFNYRLRPESPAIKAGDPAYVGEISLYDIDGLNRLADGNPDLGAYVFKPQPTEDPGLTSP